MTEPSLNAVIAEAVKKAQIAWVAVGDAPAACVWCLWVDEALYVVCGPGEQADPGLADARACVVTLRGDHNGRVVDFPAVVERLNPEAASAVADGSVIAGSSDEAGPSAAASSADAGGQPGSAAGPAAADGRTAEPARDAETGPDIANGQPAGGEPEGTVASVWDTVAAALAAKRLNATGEDTVTRWRRECAIFRLTPDASAAPATGRALPAEDLAAVSVPSLAARPTRKPFRLHRVKRKHR